MKKWFWRASPLVLFLLYGLALNQFELRIFPTGLRGKYNSGWYDYKGVTHAHSDLSTGAAGFSEIMSAGQDAELDFLILTDLNLYDSPHPQASYYGQMLFINAAEVGFLDSHLLYYGGPKPLPFQSAGQAQIMLSDMMSQKQISTDEGFLALAHPLQKGYEWSGEYPKGISGIEILNLASLWEDAKEKTRVSLGWSFVAYLFNPHLAVFRLFLEPEKEIRLWDQLQKKQRVVGLVGNDTSAKALITENRVFQFPSYQMSFEIASNHILTKSELTGEPSKDRKKILSALHNGQFYLCIDTIARPEGFVAELRRGQKSWPLGSEVRLKKGMEIHVTLPDKPLVPFETVIFRDGERVVTSNSQKTVASIHLPGTYRVMVRVSPTLPLPDGKRWFPWIYTNPFFVK